jgi:hypothetical protein
MTYTKEEIKYIKKIINKIRCKNYKYLSEVPDLNVIEDYLRLYRYDFEKANFIFQKSAYRDYIFCYILFWIYKNNLHARNYKNEDVLTLWKLEHEH